MPGERSAWYRVPAFACNENDNNKAANLTKLALRERGFPKGRENHHTACLRGGRESLEPHPKCSHLWNVATVSGFSSGWQAGWQDLQEARHSPLLQDFLSWADYSALCSRSIWRWGRACYFSWRKSTKGSEYRSRQPGAIVFSVFATVHQPAKMEIRNYHLENWGVAFMFIWVPQPVSFYYVLPKICMYWMCCHYNSERQIVFLIFRWDRKCKWFA